MMMRAGVVAQSRSEAKGEERESGMTCDADKKRDDLVYTRVKI